MAGWRGERVGKLVHQEITRMLREDVKDPRIPAISITGVTMSPDLSVAKVRYVRTGGGVVGPDALAGVAQADKFMRGPVGRVLGIRHSPDLRFEVDKNVEHAAEMDILFANLPPKATE